MKGPQKELMRFFTAICSCEGKQIISNQELCLRQLYLNQQTRRELLVETMSFIDQWQPPAPALGMERPYQGFDYFYNQNDQSRSKRRGLLRDSKRHNNNLAAEVHAGAEPKIFCASYGERTKIDRQANKVRTNKSECRNLTTILSTSIIIQSIQTCQYDPSHCTINAPLLNES
jgi:hypothetical protein